MAMLAGFEVIGRVASGSTATVWKARDPRLDRLVALKQVLRPTAEQRAMWEREAAVLADLAGPHLAQVYGLRVGDDGTAYLVTEWIDGATLSALMAGPATISGPQAVGLIRGALLGLARAHARGVVHNDISPNNIMVTPEGESVLIDFGLASVAGARAATTGTRAYAAPEVLAGAPAQPSADVHAAAAVLVHLVTGRPGTAREAARIGDHLGAVLTRALAEDPGARQPDAAALLTDLEDAAERRFGADWLARAGAAGLVSATGSAAVLMAAGGTVASSVAGSGAGGVTAASTVTTAGTATSATSTSLGGNAAGSLPTSSGASAFAPVDDAGRHGARLSRKLIAGGGIGAAAVAVTAVVLLTGGDDNPDYATAFTGTYRVRAVVTTARANGVVNQAVPHRVGATTTQYWTVRARCDRTPCTATVTVADSTTTAASLSRGTTFRLVGGRWAGTGGETNRCADADQNPSPGTSYVDRYRISLTAPGSGRPSTLTGTGTYFSAGRTPPACTGSLRLSFTYTLTRVASSAVPSHSTSTSTPPPTPVGTPAPPADAALAGKALILGSDVPAGWAPADPAADLRPCDYVAGSATLRLGRGARVDGDRFRDRDTSRYLSSTSYVFASQKASDAFVRQFESAGYLKCVKRQTVAALPDPPVGVTFTDAHPPKPVVDKQGNGYLAFRYLVQYQIEDAKYVESDRTLFTWLHRIGRVITVATLEARNTSADIDAAQRVLNAADARILRRVTASLARER